MNSVENLGEDIASFPSNVKVVVNENNIRHCSFPSPFYQVGLQKNAVMQEFTV